ncbi:MAG: LysM peptidoglycan-binding domain-containing protein [Caldilineaceae bacterium]|nr:LysM peptidoglycan-binding domain-containing protein [Caldilineaceae bacterium]
MQEVVCFNCGRIVDISPDAELCSVCGENLRELLHPAYISTYFYDRAAEMAANDELLQALREIDRGLTYHDSSELRLLGAILSQRIGDFEQMRNHVAAVPVNDVLRSEAEWLLRSHQTRQRAQRTGAKTPAERSPSLAEIDPLPPLPLVTQNSALTTNPSPPVEQQVASTETNSSVLYLGVGLLALVMAGVLVLNTFYPAYLSWLPLFGNSTLNDSVSESQTTGPAETVRQSDTVTAGSDRSTGGDSGTGNNPVLQPTPTATVDVLVPPDVVVGPLDPLANSTPNELRFSLDLYEMTTYLTEQNRPDLAALDVSASSQEGTILLKGIVPSFQARQDLLTLMEQAPGVTRVSGADLLIRLPPTYTVQAGDTLWAISAKFYGEYKREELLEANQGVLTSPDALRVGMELTLPTLNE